jgi:RNA polymerase sigma-70 factor, ECF subfamily
MDLATQIRAIAAGDRNAFSQMYREQHKAMLAYAAGILAGDREAAEDAVDEAFLDIWKGAGNFAAIGHAEGWLGRIVRNKAVDWLRKQKGKVLPFELAEQGGLADDRCTPEEYAAQDSDAIWLRKALSKLSTEQREAIILCYYEDRSVADIAAVMGCPQNTVKTRLFHARKHLFAFVQEAASV